MCTAAHCMYTYVLYTTDVCMNTTQHGTAQNTNRTDSEESELHSLHIYRIRYLSLSPALAHSECVCVVDLFRYPFTQTERVCICIFCVCARYGVKWESGIQLFSQYINTLLECAIVIHITHTYEKGERARKQERQKHLHKDKSTVTGSI